jgi:hypothetical protein
MILTDRRSTDNASIHHLQHFARTAATVVSFASTVAEDDSFDEYAETLDAVSECDWFVSVSASSELTLDWVPSLHSRPTVSSNVPARSPDHGTNARDRSLASRYTPTPYSPHDVGLTHGHTRQTNEGSITLTPLIRSSLDAGRVVRFASQQSFLGGDETAKNTVIRKCRSFSSKLLSPRIKSKTTIRSREPSPSVSPLCKDDLKMNSAGQVMPKWTFLGDRACGKTLF